jgi:transglutaminase-like putative cysteine protease
MGAAIKGIAVTIVVIIALTVAYYVVEDTNLLNGVRNVSTSSYQIPSEISTQFSRNFSFTSDKGFAFYLTPIVTNSLQHSSLSVSHSSNVDVSLQNSQNRTYWQMNINPGQSYVNITYNVTSYGKTWQYLSNSTGVPSQIPLYMKTQYDHPEFFNYSSTHLEVINPSFFRNLTLHVTRNETTVAGMLDAIYNYIVQNYRYNISYNLGNVPLSAQQVYQRGEGDCEELSYLFESMSRSIGIPSWTQYGLLIQESNGQASLGEHAWVQTYIPSSNGNGAYVNIDLTVEVGGRDLGRGFLVKYPYSLVEWTDNGNSSAMVSYHTQIEAPSGINLSQSEADYIHSFSQSGTIVIAQANIFNLIVANTSKESI